MPTQTPTQKPTWNGNAMSTQDLCALVGITRTQLWRDRQANLLPLIPKRPGVRTLIYPAHAIKRYLTLKYPQLLPTA